jgi:hypothetical protein
VLGGLGVLLCQFHGGVTSTGVSPLDGNWPEMNLRPAAAFLHGAVSVSLLSPNLAPPRVIAFFLWLLDRQHELRIWGLRFPFLTRGRTPTAVGHGRSEIARG